jgi:hypothetical protein
MDIRQDQAGQSNNYLASRPSTDCCVVESHANELMYLPMDLICCSSPSQRLYHPNLLVWLGLGIAHLQESDSFHSHQVRAHDEKWEVVCSSNTGVDLLLVGICVGAIALPPWITIW